MCHALKHSTVLNSCSCHCPLSHPCTNTLLYSISYWNQYSYFCSHNPNSHVSARTKYGPFKQYELPLPLLLLCTVPLPASTSTSPTDLLFACYISHAFRPSPFSFFLSFTAFYQRHLSHHFHAHTNTNNTKDRHTHNPPHTHTHSHSLTQTHALTLPTSYLVVSIVSIYTHDLAVHLNN